MDFDRPMSFDDTFRAIRCGDCRMLVAFSLECLIMSSGPAILFGAWYFR